MSRKPWTIEQVSIVDRKTGKRLAELFYGIGPRRQAVTDDPLFQVTTHDGMGHRVTYFLTRPGRAAPEGHTAIISSDVLDKLDTAIDQGNAKKAQNTLREIVRDIPRLKYPRGYNPNWLLFANISNAISRGNFSLARRRLIKTREKLNA